MSRTHAIAATADTDIHFAEQPEIGLRDRRRKVLLECNGESSDFRSVHLLSTQFVVRDIELVAFTCPRCGARHQSLLFG